MTGHRPSIKRLTLTRTREDWQLSILQSQARVCRFPHEVYLHRKAQGIFQIKFRTKNFKGSNPPALAWEAVYITTSLPQLFCLVSTGSPQVYLLRVLFWNSLNGATYISPFVWFMETILSLSIFHLFFNISFFYFIGSLSFIYVFVCTTIYVIGLIKELKQ